MPEEPAPRMDWEALRSWIGRNLVAKPEWGAEPAEWGSIRHQLEALEFDCPLHYDEEVARRYGYKGVFAPYHMMQVFSRPPYWKPGDATRWPTDDREHAVWILEDPENLQMPIPATGAAGTGTIVTGLEMTFVRPLYVGEWVIRTEEKLVEISPRETRIGTGGAFLTHESRYETQHGDLLAIQRITTYKYIPRAQPS